MSKKEKPVVEEVQEEESIQDVLIDNKILENLLEEVETLNLPASVPGADNNVDVMTKNFGFSCNNCIINDSCKAFKADATCSIPLFESDIDPDKDMEYLLLAQKFRVKRGLMIESVQGGGVLDTQLSSEMRFMVDLIERREGKGTGGNSISINATGEVAKNMTKQGGILSQLLSPDKKEVEIKSDPVKEAEVVVDVPTNPGP